MTATQEERLHWLWKTVASGNSLLDDVDVRDVAAAVVVE